jgi:hypothetical protein
VKRWLAVVAGLLLVFFVAVPPLEAAAAFDHYASAYALTHPAQWYPLGTVSGSTCCATYSGPGAAGGGLSITTGTVASWPVSYASGGAADNPTPVVGGLYCTSYGSGASIHQGIGLTINGVFTSLAPYSALEGTCDGAVPVGSVAAGLPWVACVFFQSQSGSAPPSQGSQYFFGSGHTGDVLIATGMGNGTGFNMAQPGDAYLDSNDGFATLRFGVIDGAHTTATVSLATGTHLGCLQWTGSELRVYVDGGSTYVGHVATATPVSSGNFEGSGGSILNASGVIAFMGCDGCGDGRQYIDQTRYGLGIWTGTTAQGFSAATSAGIWNAAPPAGTCGSGGDCNTTSSTCQANGGSAHCDTGIISGSVKFQLAYLAIHDCGAENPSFPSATDVGADVGWLACEVQNFLNLLGNVLIAGLNVIIDLLLPGDNWLDPVRGLWVSAQTHAPFSYMIDAFSAVQTIGSGAATSPNVSFTFWGHPVNWSLSSALQFAVPYRGLLAGGLYVTTAFAIFSSVRRRVNG